MSSAQIQRHKQEREGKKPDKNYITRERKISTNVSNDNAIVGYICPKSSDRK